MANNEAKLAKIYEQADGERAAGNIAAAENHEAKAEKFAKQHALPQRHKSAVAEEKREFDAWLDRLSDSEQVILRILEPGMTRTTDRVFSMKDARPMLKRGSGFFVRLANGQLPPPSKAFIAHLRAHGTPDGHKPLPQPMTPAQLDELRQRGPTAEQSHFTPHETDDRGSPYNKPSDGGTSWLSKFQFWN